MSLIGGALGKIFGSEKVIDAGISGIDKAFYTKEERADDDIKKTGAKLLFMKAYEPFKLAQRLLAFMLGVPFVIIHFIIAMFWIVLILVSFIKGFPLGEIPQIYEFGVAQLQRVAEMNNQTLGEPLAWVFIFYFAGGAGEGLISKFMASRGARK